MASAGRVLKRAFRSSAGDMPLRAESKLIPLFQMGAPKVFGSINFPFWSMQKDSTTTALRSSLQLCAAETLIYAQSFSSTPVESFITSPSTKHKYGKGCYIFCYRSFTLEHTCPCTCVPLPPVAQVLLLQWMEGPSLRWQCIELFSGVGNVSAAFRQTGKAVASFDKVLSESMDITLSAGFLYKAQFRNCLNIPTQHLML